MPEGVASEPELPALAPEAVEEADENVVPKATMTVEEAEKVIAEYKPSQASQDDFPQALKELQEEILAKVEEKRQAGDKPALTMEEYFGLRFPEYSPEDASRIIRNSQNTTLITLREDLVIDTACAKCQNGERCLLPGGRNDVVTRAELGVKERHNGKAGLCVLGDGVVRCKNNAKHQSSDPEFERKVKASGLTESEAQQTFAAYDEKSAGKEATVAKAFAVQSAQKQSNLILSGKPGAGKTHLAIAIALDAMRAGRTALVKSMPELLDKICEAHQKYQDYGALIRQAQTVSCLVLDDWGKERTTDARMDYLYQIIDYRYRHNLQTIVTTNAYDMEGLMNKWNADKIEPLVSRIMENGEWVTIRDCKDYRLRRQPSAKPCEPEQVEAVPEEKAVLVEASAPSEDDFDPDKYVDDMVDMYLEAEKLGDGLDEEDEKEYEAYLKSLRENGACETASEKSEKADAIDLDAEGREDAEIEDEAGNKYVRVAVFKTDGEVEYSYVKRQIASDYVPEDDEDDEDKDDLRLYGSTGISGEDWAKFHKKKRE